MILAPHAVLTDGGSVCAAGHLMVAIAAKVSYYIFICVVRDNSDESMLFVHGLFLRSYYTLMLKIKLA